MKKEEKKTTKKVAKTEKVEKKGTKNPFKAIINWFKEEVRELKRVTWPTKRTMVKNFIATIVTVVFLGILFYAIDILMAWLKTVVM